MNKETSTTSRPFLPLSLLTIPSRRHIRIFPIKRIKYNPRVSRTECRYPGQLAFLQRIDILLRIIVSRSVPIESHPVDHLKIPNVQIPFPPLDQPTQWTGKGARVPRSLQPSITRHRTSFRYGKNTPIDGRHKMICVLVRHYRRR